MRLRLPTLLMLLLPPVACGDEALRCGSWLVTLPVSQTELLQKCGEPDYRESTAEDVRAPARGGGSRAIGTTIIEKWTYRTDPGSLPMLVTLVDGKVTRIERAR